MALSPHPLFRAGSRGAISTEYLLLSALGVGILLPFALKYFGYPLLNSLNNQRQSLVEFFAQTPKRPVPTSWFQKDRLAAVTAPNNVTTAGNVSTPGNISTPGTVSTGNVSTGNVGGGGNIGSGQPSGGQNLGGGTISGGMAGGGGGAASGASGGSSLDSGFFGDNEKGAPGSNAGSTSSNTSSNYSGTVVRGQSEDEDEGEAPASGGKVVSQKQTETPSQNKVAEEISAKKGSGLTVSQVEERERARNSKFDWWLVLKIFIIILIICLVLFIAIGNLRRR